MNEKFILFSRTTILNENMMVYQYIKFWILNARFFNMSIGGILVARDKYLLDLHPHRNSKI